MSDQAVRDPARSRPLLRTTIAALIAGVATTALAQGSPTHLLTAAERLADRELPAQARAGTGMAGNLDTKVFAVHRLAIDLADGRALAARRVREVRDPARGDSWIGEIESAPGSLIVLTRYRGAITGFLHHGSDVYELAPLPSGRHAFYRVDESTFPPFGPSLLPPAALAGDAPGTDATVAGAAASGDGVVQDILVLYSPASRTRYASSGGIESRILSAIAAANQAYANSDLALSLNLVFMGEAAYAETGDMGEALSRLRQNGDGILDEAHALRDQYGADLVALVNEDGNYCGIGYVMTSVSTGFASYAFSVTASSCLSNQTLAHEVGHNQGNMHDRDNSSNAGAYPYSYGYRRCVSDGSGFRTVMSYSCSGAPRVNQFSNPSVFLNGYPTGIAHELDPANSAEAVRSMGNTAATVAAFRQGAVNESPAVPGPLTAAAPTSSRVDLNWSDNASNETGHRVERSGNGVDFGEVATLGSNVTSYSDTSVAPRSNYWYRVRAYNSAGSSAPSNVAAVTTLDVPPAQPGSVAASVSGAQVAVTWVDQSANESGFEIARETYNSKNRRWSGLTVVGTASVDSGSYVESPASGTYRYSVRSFNAGGTSAWAGPSTSVSVSGGSSGGGKGGGKGGKRN